MLKRNNQLSKSAIMKKSLPLSMIFFLFVHSITAQNTLPAVASGQVVRIENFQSKYVTQRHVDIWLPPGYSKAKKYAVLYMHDGQMLYDPNQSWNKQAWDIDDVAGQLLSSNKLKPFIVVGIWNGGTTRHEDYFPQKPFEQLSAVDKDTVQAQLKRAGRSDKGFSPRSDSYLKFLVQELKPYIDKNYSVKTDRANTCIAGSSMGGLISLYAICEYPNIFGGAACLSTHWVGTFTADNNPVPGAFLRYLEKKLPDPKSHRIYFDCGDQTLDALYPAIQKKVDLLMQKKGFSSSNWLSQFFPGADHSEKSWNGRLAIPLEFLLGGSPIQ